MHSYLSKFAEASSTAVHSKLKLLKTYLRSTMKDDRPTSLALLYIHRGLSASPEIVEGIHSICLQRSTRGG